FFFSSRRRHTRFSRDWSSDVCSSDLTLVHGLFQRDLLLEYIRHFVLFEDDGRLVKKIAAYHQFHAVRAVVQSVLKASAPGGTRKIGRASCRERVKMTVGAGSTKQQGS